MNVHNAFMHGDLHEEVYMKLPPRFQVVSLGKLGRCVCVKLSITLGDYVFQCSYTDYSLFYSAKELSVNKCPCVCRRFHYFWQ